MGVYFYLVSMVVVNVEVLFIMIIYGICMEQMVCMVYFGLNDLVESLWLDLESRKGVFWVLCV